MAFVSVYLNFPRNTEEVFKFYQTVFKVEKLDLNRFNEIPESDGMPPIAEADKNLIMHAELEILNGFKLMGTDPPESMGFNVNFGNNMHISLSPDTRAETKILFDALAENGTITMALDDMFWGAYYGSVTDKFGIQWMFNFSEK